LLDFCSWALLLIIASGRRPQSSEIPRPISTRQIRPLLAKPGQGRAWSIRTKASLGQRQTTHTCISRKRQLRQTPRRRSPAAGVRYSTTSHDKRTRLWCAFHICRCAKRAREIVGHGIWCSIAFHHLLEASTFRDVSDEREKPFTDSKGPQSFQKHGFSPVDGRIVCWLHPDQFIFPSVSA